MLEQAKLGEKHKHLLELERTDIKDRIDTDVQEKTDGVFWCALRRTSLMGESP